MKPSHKLTRTLSTSDLTSVKGAGLFSSVIDTLERWLTADKDDGSKSTTTGRHAEREAAGSRQ